MTENEPLSGKGFKPCDLGAPVKMSDQEIIASLREQLQFANHAMIQRGKQRDRLQTLADLVPGLIEALTWAFENIEPPYRLVVLKHHVKRNEAYHLELNKHMEALAQRILKGEK